MDNYFLNLINYIRILESKEIPTTPLFIFAAAIYFTISIFGTLVSKVSLLFCLPIIVLCSKNTINWYLNDLFNGSFDCLNQILVFLAVFVVLYVVIYYFGTYLALIYIFDLQNLATKKEFLDLGFLVVILFVMAFIPCLVRDLGLAVLFSVIGSFCFFIFGEKLEILNLNILPSLNSRKIFLSDECFQIVIWNIFLGIGVQISIAVFKEKERMNK